MWVFEEGETPLFVLKVDQSTQNYLLLAWSCLP